MFDNLQSVTILGRQPALGVAELESLYGDAALTPISDQVVGLTTPPNEIDFSRLGGCTRLAEVVAIVPSKLWKDVEKALAKAVPELARQLPEGKLQLGLSAYGIPITTAKLNASGLQLKKIIRAKTDRSVRLIPNPELELNTAQVLHNHLTGATGIEMLIVATDSGSTLLARTVAVQDIDSYTLRDRGRPRRDARVGMLPPKLAQILINLAVGRQTTNDKRQTVLDPFCGTGVLLQEALLMGYDAYGTDLEQRMIDYSHENLNWCVSRFQISDSRSQLTAADATTHPWNLSTLTPLPTALSVASETYLGRPFTEKPSAEMVAQTASDVNLILKKFLRNIHGQLAPGTRLCLAVPAWALQPTLLGGQWSLHHGFKTLPLIDQIADMGYNLTKFEHVSGHNLVYYREDQFTARQLLVLTRQ